MKLHAKVHLSMMLVILAILCVMTMITPSLTQTDLQPSGLPTDILDSLLQQEQRNRILLPLLILGSVNGYYLYIRFIKDHSSIQKGMAVLFGFLLVSMITILGVLTYLPLMILDLYQLYRHNVWYTIGTHGIHGVTSTQFEDMPDEKSRLKLIAYTKKRNRLRIPLILLLLFLNLVASVLLGNFTYHQHEVAFTIEGFPILVALALLVLSLFVYQLIKSRIEGMLMLPIVSLLEDHCDPYRMTLVMDYLLDHRLINPSLGQYYLLISLKEQDNKARITQLLTIRNPLYKKTNLYNIANHARLSKQEQKDNIDDYYQKMMAKLGELNKKTDETNPLIVQAEHHLKAYYEYQKGHYENALQELEKETVSTALDKQKQRFLQGEILWEKKEQDIACTFFSQVAQEGGSLAICEESRNYLETFHSLQHKGEVLPPFS